MRVCQPLDPADKSIHPGTVLMMHLRGFSGLSQSIGFINQQDDPTTRLSAMTPQFGRFRNGVVECRRDKLRHLSNTSLPSRRETQREKRQIDVLLPRNG